MYNSKVHSHIHSTGCVNTGHQRRTSTNSSKSEVHDGDEKALEMKKLISAISGRITANRIISEEWRRALNYQRQLMQLACCSGGLDRKFERFPFSFLLLNCIIAHIVSEIRL